MSLVVVVDVVMELSRLAPTPEEEEGGRGGKREKTNKIDTKRGQDGDLFPARRSVPRHLFLSSQLHLFTYSFCIICLLSNPLFIFFF